MTHSLDVFTLPPRLSRHPNAISLEESAFRPLRYRIKSLRLSWQRLSQLARGRALERQSPRTSTDLVTSWTARLWHWCKLVASNAKHKERRELLVTSNNESMVT